MKRTIYDCDKCGKPNLPFPVHLKLAIEKDFDDHQYIDVVKTIDLCTVCAETLMQEWLQDASYEVQHNIYKKHFKSYASKQP